METSSESFIEIWDSYLIMGSYVFFGLAVLITLFHEGKVISITNEKNRYDYVNTHEIKYFWYAIIAFMVGFALYITATLTPLFPVDDSLKLYISIFFLAGIIIITYLILSSVVRILYPRFLEKRLIRIRNKPRKSSAGNLMRKLNSQEGEVHLEADQLTRHKSDIHSSEYDVWLDDKTGEKKIEQYMANQHAEKCSECGFYTFKIDREEIEKEPTQTEEGLLLEHYKCSYCKHREAREVVIAALSSNAKS
ncbi:MAG: hypothetical protein KBF45_08170 [Cyclobacteriaceae bacterium]|jgi:hypothetical protein|nr:hypothetical protein [Cyclobacteriaceae bacterium]